VVKLEKIQISWSGGNQLPFSAARWQHGSQVCFAAIILEKLSKLLKTQNQQKLEKMSTCLASFEF
jgi:hypothetical protein